MDGSNSLVTNGVLNFPSNLLVRTQNRWFCRCLEPWVSPAQSYLQCARLGLVLVICLLKSSASLARQTTSIPELLLAASLCIRICRADHSQQRLWDAAVPRSRVGSVRLRLGARFTRLSAQVICKHGPSYGFLGPILQACLFFACCGREARLLGTYLAP